MNPVALARMRRAFREDAPSRVEIAAARARYEATVARAPAPSVGSLLRWGLAGAAVDLWRRVVVLHFDITHNSRYRTRT